MILSLSLFPFLSPSLSITPSLSHSTLVQNQMTIIYEFIYLSTLQMPVEKCMNLCLLMCNGKTERYPHTAISVYLHGTHQLLM